MRAAGGSRVEVDDEPGGAPAPGPGGRPLVLLKLGGSLITWKGRADTPRPGVIRRLAAEIAEVLPELEEALLLGHGSGSFGHPAAARAGLGDARAGRGDARVGPEGRSGVVDTQERAAALHGRVLAALREAGVAGFSIAPSSAAVGAAGAVVALDVEPLARALELGLVPVLYGDVAMDRERGAAILSTETVLAAAGERLETHGWVMRRALWAGATEGILGPDGGAIPVVRAESPEAAVRAAAGAATTDVTGGMAHRLETALRLARRGVPSWIGDGREAGAVAAALRGGSVSGTRVLPPRPGPVTGADPDR